MKDVWICLFHFVPLKYFASKYVVTWLSQGSRLLIFVKWPLKKWGKIPH